MKAPEETAPSVTKPTHVGVGSSDSRSKIHHSIGAHTSDLPQQGMSRWIHTALQKLRSFAWNYILEWRLVEARKASRWCEVSSRLAAIINDNDVVCLLKPGGLCPYCNKATALLSDVKKDAEFGLHLVDLMDDEREVLSHMLQKQNGTPVNVTFPAIFVGGMWLPGGYEELNQKCDTKEFYSLLKAIDSTRKLVHPLEAQDVPTLSSWPQLWHQAGGGTPLTFQWKIYGNVLRCIALLQICWLLPVHFMLNSESNRDYTTPFLLVLIADSLLFILIGPTPFTPFGILSTLLIWQRRGPAVPMLPYKLTFILYLVCPIGIIACPRDDKGFVCDLVGGDAMVWTMITNSIYLTIFRF